MVHIIHCPSCQRRLQLPDGELECFLKCAACQAEFGKATDWATRHKRTLREATGDGHFREGETQISASEIREIQGETPPTFSVVARKPREGTVRRTFAAVGFFGGILLGLGLFLGFTIGEVVQAILFAPLVGIFLAAIGAGVGSWIELVVRLVNRPRGSSLLLTLAGDEDRTDQAEGTVTRKENPTNRLMAVPI
jgi:hypothetical protein